PWLKGVTTVVYDGEYTPESLFGILEKYHITVWYTSPILLRKLVSTGDIIHAYDLSSIRHILSVGELFSPEIITWGLKNFRVRVHHTSLLTDTAAQAFASF